MKIYTCTSRTGGTKQSLPWEGNFVVMLLASWKYLAYNINTIILS